MIINLGMAICELKIQKQENSGLSNIGLNPGSCIQNLANETKDFH